MIAFELCRTDEIECHDQSAIWRHQSARAIMATYLGITHGPTWNGRCPYPHRLADRHVMLGERLFPLAAPSTASGPPMRLLRQRQTHYACTPRLIFRFWAAGGFRQEPPRSRTFADEIAHHDNSQSISLHRSRVFARLNVVASVGRHTQEPVEYFLGAAQVGAPPRSPTHKGSQRTRPIADRLATKREG